LILCVGLSPAWQQTLFFNEFAFGEVNRARRAVWCASGKVVNVAAALASLDVRHRMVTVVGSDWADRAFQRNLAATGVHVGLIGVQSSIRICTTLLVNGQPTTELVEECGPLLDEEVAVFRTPVIEEARFASAIVIAGSMPKGTDVRLWRSILEATHIPAVLDIRGPELREALATNPLLVKPNRHELAATVERPLTTEQDVIEAASELQRGGAQWVLITDGAAPALLVGGEGAFRVRGAAVKAVNPIGCGDTLAATIAWRATLGDAIPEAVRWGVAAAAANAETELPARFSRQRAEQLLPAVRVESL